jgi:hypothetical protein
VLYKAVLGVHYKRQEQKKSRQLTIFYCVHFRNICNKRLIYLIE